MVDIIVNPLHTDDDICSICLISPIPELDLCITNCGHTYCKGCLDIWMNRLKKECPICRQDIIYFMYNNNIFL